MRQKLSINLRYCYSSRRATQNMSATRNSPTNGINLRGLPLLAVAASLHYLPRCLRSKATCGKTRTTVTWVHHRSFVALLLLRNKGQYQNNSLASFATCLCRQRSGFIELQAHNRMLPKQWTWPLCSVSIISANKVSLQELTQLIWIKLLISHFPEIFFP